MQIQAILIGIITGAVSALLFASAASGTVMGLLVLFFLAPMPLAIAGLGWGATAGAAAAVAGIAIVAMLGSVSAVLFYALAIALPMAGANYLLMLSRQVSSENPDKPLVLEWYPVGRVIAYAAGWAGILAAIALLSTGSDLDALRQTLRDTFDKMISPGGPLAATFTQPLTSDEKAAFVELMVLTLPGAIANTWLSVALLNLWCAGHATRISGRLLRPWPDIAALILPPVTPIVFVVAILLTFTGGITGLIATGFAFALLAVYIMVGLAIIHWTTRSLSMRPLILLATYLSLLLLNPFSGLLLALLGIAEPVSPLRRRPVPGTGSS